MKESFDSTPQYKSIEELQKEYKERLDAILKKQLTVDNIGSFAEDALRDVSNLMQDAIKEYQSNPELKADKTLSTKEQEDDATRKLGISNVEEILDLIVKKKEQIDSLKRLIHTEVGNIDEVITPPDSMEVNMIGDKGAERFEQKVLYPRLLTLMYILQNDLEIPIESCAIQKGEVRPEMMRQTPYVRVEVPDLSRVVYVCDEEGNASYVFDGNILNGLRISITDLDLMTKDEKNKLISDHQGVGVRVIQSINWRESILGKLEGVLVDEDQVNTDERSRSEFSRKKKWPSFEDFQAEVLALYPGEGDVFAWYLEEQKNHENWPANPGGKKGVYKKEWIGWSELVGRMNRLKIEWLSLDDLRAEVRQLYPGKGSVAEWYRHEQKKHENWPANPGGKNGVYKGKWVDWSDLVGKENPNKKEWLPFDDFQAEVRALYQGENDVKGWYELEQKKHENWPSNPGGKNGAYKEWVGWPELVGRKNLKKIERLSLEDLQTEVRVLYPGEGDVQKWYREEQKNHENWPSNPQRTHREKWQGWSELVGKENHLKKKWPSFEDFQAEVLALYPGEGDVFEWYRHEQKKHENWPSSPKKTYRNNWTDWPALVSRSNFLKKEWLPYGDFQAEVRQLYPGKGSVAEWYRHEQKKHENWPAHPKDVYGESGWVGWPGLVGRPK